MSTRKQSWECQNGNYTKEWMSQRSVGSTTSKKLCNIMHEHFGLQDDGRFVLRDRYFRYLLTLEIDPLKLKALHGQLGLQIGVRWFIPPPQLKTSFGQLGTSDLRGMLNPRLGVSRFIFCFYVLNVNCVRRR